MYIDYVYITAEIDLKSARGWVPGPGDSPTMGNGICINCIIIGIPIEYIWDVYQLYISHLSHYIPFG